MRLPVEQTARSVRGIPASIALGLFLGFVLVSCQSPGETSYKFTRFAMDTVVEYTIYAPSHRVAQDAMLAAHEEVERIDSLFWEENPKSLIYAFNQTEGSVELPEEIYNFLARGKAYYEQTDGRFDLSIKPVLELYGFGSDHPIPPESSRIKERLPQVGMERLTFKPPTTVVKPSDMPFQIAVGGMAKGYAVDRAVEILRKHGIRDAIVNAGGDLYCLGQNKGKPWAVGIRHPDNPAALVDTLFISDRAVATSGDYERFYEYKGQLFHHLLNPFTGTPARGIRSATIIAPNTEVADALAKAAFIGSKQGLALLDRVPQVSGMIVDTLGIVHTSRDYPVDTPE